MVVVMYDRDCIPVPNYLVYYGLQNVLFSGAKGAKGISKTSNYAQPVAHTHAKERQNEPPDSQA